MQQTSSAHRCSMEVLTITEDPSVRLSAGIAGLDEVLQDGLIPGRAYLLRGGPGTGKTTVGLHFLTAGCFESEKPLFITLAETEEQTRKDAEAIGFDLEGVTFLDLSPSSAFFTMEEYPGIGLGLATVRNAMELTGGHVGVTSVPGAGSTFWIELSPGEKDDESTADR
jgi:KaiC/Histidine kinase-, DNA gyrase B-, and HSP90-like ATPase